MDGTFRLFHCVRDYSWAHEVNLVSERSSLTIIPAVSGAYRTSPGTAVIYPPLALPVTHYLRALSGRRAIDYSLPCAWRWVGYAHGIGGGRRRGEKKQRFFLTTPQSSGGVQL